MSKFHRTASSQDAHPRVESAHIPVATIPSLKPVNIYVRNRGAYDTLAKGSELQHDFPFRDNRLTCIDDPL
jgi:hypothetical protein